jgi:hypothetical protein
MKPRFSAKDLVDADPEVSVELSDHSLGLPANTINPELEKTLLQLWDASEFLEALENPVSESDFFCFSIKRISIEDRLFNFGTSNANCYQISLKQIDECCRFAFILYVCTDSAT